MAKVIQMALTPTHGHLVALDSDGQIWWRPWNKRGWGKIEPVPVTPDNTPTITPPVAPAIPQVDLSIPLPEHPAVAVPSPLLEPKYPAIPAVPQVTPPTDPA